ncbi:MAG TPA: hypothetical protein VMW16_04860 [Sedimentisphaerales bacterium]|nr:hypothetical protein [Sedimentisphaerales bacterium]
MDTNEYKGQEGECGGESSAQGSEASCSCGSAVGKGWKRIIFVVVILLAGAVAAHSLVKNAARSPCAGSAGRACRLEKAAVPDKGCVLAASDVNEATCPLAAKGNAPPSSCPKRSGPACCPKMSGPVSCPKAASD